MASLFNNAARSIDPAVIFKDSQLEPFVKSHLSKVYSCLTLTLFTASIGAITHLYLNIGGLLTSLAAMFLIMSLATDFDKQSPNRILKLAAIGFFKGASIGPLIGYAVMVDPSIVIKALLGTTTIFVCFTLSALAASRRSYMYLGGILGSCMSFLFWSALFNLFFRSSFLVDVQIYLGLLVFCGYVLFDTQMMLEKVRSGNEDYMMHAVELFINFIAIFVRLLIILTKNKQQDNERDRKRRN